MRGENRHREIQIMPLAPAVALIRWCGRRAALEGAQARVIQSEYDYNYAKPTLARNTGVVGTQYRTYLGR
jgi:hypothetical protein